MSDINTLLSEASTGSGDLSDTSGLDSSDPSYNYITPANQITNQDAATILSDQGSYSPSTLLNGVQAMAPSTSITPNSAQQASPDLFSQLFSNLGSAVNPASTKRQ